MARKAWSQLSTGYRSRLERHGITEQSHAAGRSIAKGRGHENTPEHGNYIAKAEEYGIGFLVTDWEEMLTEDSIGARTIAKMYVQGWMTPGQAKGVHKKARVDFDEWAYDTGHEWDRHQWKIYRAMYAAYFHGGPRYAVF